MSDDFAAAWRKAVADLHRDQRNKRGKRRALAAEYRYRIPDVAAGPSPTATTTNPTNQPATER